GVAGDHDLHRIVKIHHRRHSLRKAERRGPVARTAGFLVRQDRLVARLILGRERRLLAASEPARRTNAAPLPGEIRIFRFIERLCAPHGQIDRSDHDSAEHAASTHVFLPVAVTFRTLERPTAIHSSEYEIDRAIGRWRLVLKLSVVIPAEPTGPREARPDD